MKKNTGTDYEFLTQEVFSRLHAQQGLCTCVERNVFLTGKSGASHQIDVTFSFEVGGVSYRTIVQCKDWGSPVKQGQVLEFQQVLNEIPGQPRGIIVARSGFQEGARTLAEHHGIKLYELREPREEDWQGLIRRVVMRMVIRVPHFDDVRLVFDEAHVRQEFHARGIMHFEQDFGCGLDELFVETGSGEPYDIQQVLNDKIPRDAGDGPFRFRYDFGEAVFASVPGCPIPRLAVAAIEATVRFTETRSEHKISLDHLIAYCFRDVLAGKVEFLRQDGTPTPAGVRSVRTKRGL